MGLSRGMELRRGNFCKSSPAPPQNFLGLGSLRRWVDIGGKGLYYALFRRGLAVEEGLLWRNRGGLGLTAAGIVMGVGEVAVQRIGCRIESSGM